MRGKQPKPKPAAPRHLIDILPDTSGHFSWTHPVFALRVRAFGLVLFVIVDSHMCFYLLAPRHALLTPLQYDVRDD